MSSDVMLICPERDESFDKNHEACFYICEASAGEPWTEFGKMICSYGWTTIDDEFIARVKRWHGVLEGGGDVDLDALVAWLTERRGLTYRTENW
jgi:hypothetical protein